MSRKPRPNILIVEDEAIIALGLSCAVEDSDAAVVGPVASVADALDLVATVQLDGAVLDANLVDGTVTPLALRLIDLGIPFVIHTGTGMPIELAGEPVPPPLVMKPVPATRVVAILLERLGDPRT